jgi:hypothetical protein
LSSGTNLGLASHTIAIQSPSLAYQADGCRQFLVWAFLNEGPVPPRLDEDVPTTATKVVGRLDEDVPTAATKVVGRLDEDVPTAAIKVVGTC